MSTNINMVMNRRYEVLRIGDIEHGKKDFLRHAASALAKKILENGDVIQHQSQYDLNNNRFVTSFSVIVGQKERKLP